MIKLEKAGHTARVLVDRDGVRLSVTDDQAKTSTTLIPQCDNANIVAARITSSLVRDGWDIV
jgi:hypothetical protein